MTESISFSEIDGEVKAFPSKSLMQRAIAISLLGEGVTRITNAGMCDDAWSASGVAESLGADISNYGSIITVEGGLRLRKSTLDCGESGLCLRMFSVISSLFDVPVTLTGSGTLLKRPVFMMERPLRDLGVECSTNYGLPPVTIKGPVRPGRTFIDGTVSSQFLTGLLITLPLLDGDSEIMARNLKSKPYISLTLQIMEEFGVVIENRDFRHFFIKGGQKYKNHDFEIEGDWSSSAFILAAGAIGGRVIIRGLNPCSLQADSRILEVLKIIGADLITGENFVEVRRGNLKSFDFDANDCPDLIPPLISLAAHCDGKSIIKGVRRLTYKESNRGETLKKEFSKLGVRINILEDSITVQKCELKPAVINSHNDHRIAMALAIAALGIRGGTTIENSQCINKSYPGFFHDLNLIRV